MKKIRLGILGLDNWYYAYPLAECCKRNTNIELVSVSHSDEKALKDFAEKYDIKKHSSDHYDLINDPEIDALILSSYTASHYELCSKAIPNQKDILCIKPMAVNANEARKIEELVRQHNTNFMMCHDFRYTPCYVKAKQFVDAGVIGKLRGAIYTVRVPAPQGFPSAKDPGWYVEKTKSGGGGFLDHASHMIDLLLWYFEKSRDQVVRVYAEKGNLIHKEWDVEDYGISIIKFDDGSLVTVESTFTGSEGSGYVESLSVFGDHGDMYISRNEKPPIRILGKTKDISERIYVDVQMPSLTIGIENTLSAFAECLINEKEVPISTEAGRNVLEITDAAYRSAKDNKPVSIVR